jgi:hypothetical protein
MWEQYPKHILEEKQEIPYVEIPPIDAKPLMDKKTRPHFLTSYARRRFPVTEYNRNH